MIYITQLIFVREGKEEIFHEFEEHVLPLLGKFNGKILCRIRPGKNNFIFCDGERPYEIHFVSFDSAKDLENYMNDDGRRKFLHMKEESVKSMLMVKGEAFGR